MPAHDFTRRPGEDLADYVARLEAIPAEDLSPQMESARRFHLQAAEEALHIAGEKAGRPPAAPAPPPPPAAKRSAPRDEAQGQDALARCRRAYLDMSPEDRQQFILWLVRGAPPP